MSLIDYIIVIKKAVPFELCDAIIDEYKNSSEWAEASVSKKEEVNRDIRNCSVISMSAEDVITKNVNTRLNLDKQMFEVVSGCIKEYNAKFPHCTVERDTGYELLRYKEGCFYTEHVDSFTQRYRAVSCSILLNDEFEGGEFAFFKGTEVYKLDKGDALMFPSNFLFPHEVKPVTFGTRYSIVTWFQ